MRIGTMTSALGVRRETGEKIPHAEVVRRCAAAGVEVFALECETAPGYVKAVRGIPVRL